MKIMCPAAGGGLPCLAGMCRKQCVGSVPVSLPACSGSDASAASAAKVDVTGCAAVRRRAVNMQAGDPQCSQCPMQPASGCSRTTRTARTCPSAPNARMQLRVPTAAAARCTRWGVAYIAACTGLPLLQAYACMPQVKTPHVQLLHRTISGLMRGRVEAPTACSLGHPWHVSAQCIAPALQCIAPALQWAQCIALALLAKSKSRRACALLPSCRACRAHHPIPGAQRFRAGGDVSTGPCAQPAPRAHTSSSVMVRGRST